MNWPVSSADDVAVADFMVERKARHLIPQSMSLANQAVKSIIKCQMAVFFVSFSPFHHN